MLASVGGPGRGGPVAYSIRGQDSGADCPGEFRTETDDELMKHFSSAICPETGADADENA